MLKKSGCLQPWPYPKHSTPLGPPLYASLHSYAGSVILSRHAVWAPYRRSEITMDAIPSPCKHHRLPQCLHYDLNARPWSSCCIDGDITALPRGLYGVHTTLLLELRATAFVLSMFKMNAIPRCPVRSHGVPWRCHRVATSAFCICLECNENAATMTSSPYRVGIV